MNQNDTSEHKLMLAEVLGMLMADGLIEQSQADALTAARRGQRHDSHPLVLIAEQNWRSHTPPTNCCTLKP